MQPRLTRRYGMWAASWHDGAQFIDPDPARAVALAEADRRRREGERAPESARALDLTPAPRRKLARGAA